MNDCEKEEYRNRNRKAVSAMLALIPVLIILYFLSLSASTLKIGIAESLEIFVNHLKGIEPEGFLPALKDSVVFGENAPRALGAVCAGAVLASCGAALQSLIRNPLADPYTLGISSGALFGMVVFVGLGISIVPGIAEGNARIVNAFALSLIPTAVVIAVAVFRKVSPTMMILCGIAVMYVFTAFTTLIKYTVESEILSEIYHWSIGSVSGISWGAVAKMIPAVIIAIVPLMYWSGKIDAVSQGDKIAHSLGINADRLRILALVVVSVSTAIIVCYTGTIGFVGLVAPHIARIFVGSKSSVLIPCSALIGALMVLASDCAVRSVAPTLPVGVVLALVCSPVFILILVNMRKSVW